MPRKDPCTLKSLEHAIARFNAEHLKAHVMPIFPEFKWKEIRDNIVKERLVLNKMNISKIMSKIFGQQRPTENEIRMRISSLKLIEVSTYPARRMWSAFLLGKREGGLPLEISDEELDTALGHGLRQAEVSGMRQVTVHDGMYWIMILPTKRLKTSRIITYQVPAFYAYAPGCQYLFAAHKRGPGNPLHLEAIRRALGYQKVKALMLEGSDLKGLLHMLKCKEDNCADISIMKLDEPELPPPYIHVVNGGLRVSERKSRIEYAENVFGKHPPVLKSLTLAAIDLQPPNELWGRQPIDVRLTFTSNNVFEYMKEMTAAGILRTPYPSYMHSLTKKGKNIIQLKMERTENGEM